MTYLLGPIKLEMQMIKKDKSFGAFLREVRESSKISLRKLAEEAELDPAYLSRIERGKIQRPGREIIETIAAALCRKKELQEVECEELNRQLLLKAKYRLSDADLLGLKPDQSITTEELFAQRLRDKGVPEPFVLDAKKKVPLHLMSKVLSGEEPLHIKKINETSSKQIDHQKSLGEKVIELNLSQDFSSFENSASDYINNNLSNFETYSRPSHSRARQRQKSKERKFRAGARAFIQVDGDLNSSQEEQLRALTTVVRSILKGNK